MNRFYDQRRLERLRLQREVARGAMLAARDMRDRCRQTYLEVLAVHQAQFEAPVLAHAIPPSSGLAGGNGLTLQQAAHYISNRGQKERFPEGFKKSERAVADAHEALDRAQREVGDLREQDSYASALFAAVNAHIEEHQYKSSTDTRTPLLEWSMVAGFPTIMLSLDTARIFVDERRSAICRHAQIRNESRARHISKAQALRRIDEEMARISGASPAAASLAYMLQPGGNAQTLLSHEAPQIAHGGAAVPGELAVSLNAGLLVSVLGDTIRQRYIEQLDRFYEVNGPGLSDEDRATAIAAAEQEIWREGVLEEHAIRAAEAMGLNIRRRRDADLDIVLGPLVDEFRGSAILVSEDRVN